MRHSGGCTCHAASSPRSQPWLGTTHTAPWLCCNDSWGKMRHTRVVAQAVQGATTWHITTVARRQERSQLSCLRGDVVVTREVLRHQKFHDTGQGDANGHGVGVNSLFPSSMYVCMYT